MMEKAYTVKEVAEMLGVSPKTITRRIKQGELEAFLPSTLSDPQYYIIEPSLAQFLATKTHLPEVRRYIDLRHRAAVALLNQGREIKDDKT